MLNRIRHTVRNRLGRVVDGVIAAHDRRLEDAVERRVADGVDRAIRAMHDVEFRSRRDIHVAAEREAAAASGRFAREVMPTAPSFDAPIPTLEYALTLVPEEGMALEFGVFSGTTLRVIAEARRRQDVYGFDSFKGLPEDWRSNIPAGTFGVDDLPDVPGAELVVGWFDETLPEFMASHPGPVAFLHADADLYSSTVTILEHVGPRLRAGSVIVFDEYFNYPGWEQHEHKAWQEYVAKSGIRFRYVAYTMNNEQVVVVVTGTA